MGIMVKGILRVNGCSLTAFSPSKTKAVSTKGPMDLETRNSIACERLRKSPVLTSESTFSSKGFEMVMVTLSLSIGKFFIVNRL
jgi:hypothetical protein